MACVIIVEICSLSLTGDEDGSEVGDEDFTRVGLADGTAVTAVGLREGLVVGAFVGGALGW